MALNPFSVIEIEPESNESATALGIDDKRAQFLCLYAGECFNKWLGMEKPKFSKLLEMITEPCKNSNEGGMIVSSVFYQMGVWDGKGADPEQFRSLMDNLK